MCAGFELLIEVDIARNILLGVLMLEYKLPSFELMATRGVLILLPDEFVKRLWNASMFDMGPLLETYLPTIHPLKWQ